MGLFSEYLPPCFYLDNYILGSPPSENCDYIAPYCFTMSRYTKDNVRRNVFIPEIRSYLVVQNYIKQQSIIKELIEFTESEKFSFSPIIASEDSIIVHEVSYAGEVTDSRVWSSINKWKYF